jgi:type II secretion system protein C
MVNSKNLYIKSAIYGSTLSILSLSALNFYLPSHSIIKSGEQPFHQFYIYKLGQLFVDDIKLEAPKKEEPPKKEEKIYDLKKWKLVGTFLSKNDGFATVEDGKDVQIIVLNDIYKGYELVDLKIEEAIFKNSGKLYNLKINEEKIRKDITDAKNKKGNKNNKTEIEEISENKNINIETKVDPKTNEVRSANVKRDDINFYVKNVGQIWQNIRFKDYREDRQLKGFQVTFVKNGSSFQQLGLQAGDIILAINGEEVTSYAQVQKYYTNIGKMKSLNLKIKRNGEEKDIDYAIN